MGQRAAILLPGFDSRSVLRSPGARPHYFATRAGYDVGIFKETGSGAKTDRVERKKVMTLAQARHMRVAGLSRWGRSTLDLLHSLTELEARRVSVIAMSGLAFDLTTPHGRMIATIIAGIADFERELIQERIRSGSAIGLSRSRAFGRRVNPRDSRDRSLEHRLSRSRRSAFAHARRQHPGQPSRPCCAPRLGAYRPDRRLCLVHR